MTRHQLRELTTEAPAPKPYDHARWPEHVHRVARTAAILAAMRPDSVADLSCGDAAIVTAAGLHGSAVLGDIMPGWSICGPIEHTIKQIPAVDVFVCSETLEHVRDPDGLLAAIRLKAGRLLLSTPCGEADAENPEHYWGWDASDLDGMLAAAGWTGREVELYAPPPRAGESEPYYTYQIWKCS
jgi:hypothetical protein